MLINLKKKNNQYILEDCEMKSIIVVAILIGSLCKADNFLDQCLEKSPGNDEDIRELIEVKHIRYL